LESTVEKGGSLFFSDDNHEDDERRKVMGQAFKMGFLTGWAAIIARYIFSHAETAEAFSPPQRLHSAGASGNRLGG
jgi:hypothetical protein